MLVTSLFCSSTLCLLVWQKIPKVIAFIDYPLPFNIFIQITVFDKKKNQVGSAKHFFNFGASFCVKIKTLIFRVIKKLVSIRRRDGETTRRDDETRRRDETARRRDARIVGVQNPYRTFRIFGHHFLGHYLGQSKRRRDDETTRRRDGETTRRRDDPHHLKLCFLFRLVVSSSLRLFVSSSRRLVVSSSRRLFVSSSK